MDDTISRQDAIETVRKAKNLYQAHRRLLQLPSAQPERTCVNCGRTHMKIFETMHSIDVYRKTLTKTTEIQTGDQIRVGHYTATCQTVTPKGALFLLDQYLDEAYPMNRKSTNKGGYAESDLRETLRSKEILDLFDDWGDRMVPFDNGDLLRIPFFGEIFGQEDAEYFEPDGCEQWELMKDRKNRIAFRQNCWEWGWFQNKRKGSATHFALVDSRGSADCSNASHSYGVRPAFLISGDCEEAGGSQG